MKKVSWFNLVPAYEDVCRESLLELSITLQANYPDAPEIVLERTSADETMALSQLTTFRFNAATPEEQSFLQRYDKIFGFCSGAEVFVSDARLQNPLAVWGAAMRGDFALVWTPNNKHLIWHEFLHLLWADDCYDSRGFSTCEESHCIMQYVPNDKNCANSLTLCRRNHSRVVQMNIH